MKFPKKVQQFGSGVVLAAALAVPVGVGSLGFAPPASAQTAAGAPQAVKDGIAQATATVQELDGLAIACLAVALTPLGAMLTLRFLNMVLSRV